jgi:hypothetical protein
MSARALPLLLAAVAIATAGCDQARTREPKPYVAAQTQLEQVVQLPGGQGTVHVLRVPTGYMESTRCVVVTSPAGGPAVSCTPKDFDIPADDPR